jgi:hypothetical protein
MEVLMDKIEKYVGELCVWCDFIFFSNDEASKNWCDPVCHKCDEKYQKGTLFEGSK